MLAERIELYRKLEEQRESRVIAYITGDRPGLETQIHPEVLDHFVQHLDAIGVVPKITLFLYTCGGNTLAAWSIVNLLHQFADRLEVIVPAKARSAGTLICLGADTVVMTKQATLGPIDPSVNGPLNPQIGGAGPQARFPVSVEAINGYIEFARSLCNENGEAIAAALQQLSQQVHPLVLGSAYRSRAQIRMLAKRLVRKQLQDEEKIEAVLNFLCSESGSHDYTIFRREARNELGLNIEKPDGEGYGLIKQLYDGLAEELQLTASFDPNVVLGQQPQASYLFKRTLLESVNGGSHAFVSEGTLTRQKVQLQPGLVQDAINDNRTFEGWRHELPHQ